MSQAQTSEGLVCSRRSIAESVTPRQWIDHIGQQYGMHCEGGENALDGGVIKERLFGNVLALDIRSGACKIEPLKTKRAPASDDLLYMKIIWDGSVELEHETHTRRFSTGGIFIVDPTEGFTELFPGEVHIAVLSIPKSQLSRRGIQTKIDGIWVPDTKMAEMLVIRDHIKSFMNLSAKLGPRFLARVGNTYLDLLDTVLGEEPMSSLRPNAAATLHRARSFIRRNFGHHDLKGRDIAEHLGISVNYLNRLFRSEGTSVTRQLWSVRLERAAEMLQANSNSRIEEVAFSCGFSDAAHFSRSFRLKYGLSPSEARRSARDAVTPSARGVALE